MMRVISICRYITGFDMVDWVNLDGPVQGIFTPDHGVSVVAMREVAVLAFKAVTR